MGEVGGAFLAGARVSQAGTENRFDFEVGNENLLLELARPSYDFAVGSEDYARAVEYQLILSANQVHIGDE